MSMLVLHPRMSVRMDMKGVGPLSVAGVGVRSVEVIGVDVMGVPVKVDWGDGVNVKVAPGCVGVSDEMSGVDGNVAVTGGARITGVGE